MKINYDEAIICIADLAGNLWNNSFEPVMTEVADLIFNDLVTDPDIPEEWMNAMAIAENRTEFELIIGPVPSLLSLREAGGTETGWKLYRCPKRRYMGGQLRRKPSKEAKFTLRKWWNDHKSVYLAMLRSNVIGNITNALR